MVLIISTRIYYSHKVDLHSFTHYFNYPFFGPFLFIQNHLIFFRIKKKKLHRKLSTSFGLIILVQLFAMASLLATRFFLNAKPDPKPKRLGLSRARNFYMCYRGGHELGQTRPDQLSSANETVKKFGHVKKHS